MHLIDGVPAKMFLDFAGFATEESFGNRIITSLKKG